MLVAWIWRSCDGQRAYNLPVDPCDVSTASSKVPRTWTIKVTTCLFLLVISTQVVEIKACWNAPNSAGDLICVVFGPEWYLVGSNSLFQAADKLAWSVQPCEGGITWVKLSPSWPRSLSLVRVAGVSWAYSHPSLNLTLVSSNPT